MHGDVHSLADCFLKFDVPHPSGPGHFAFFVPSDEAYRRWQHYPAAARPETGRAGSGRGLTAEACRASGIGEAVERASCCAWPNEPLVYASVNEVGTEAIPPDELLGFSRSQKHDRAFWNEVFAGVDWCPPTAPRDVELAWTPALNSMTGQECLVPADYTLIGRKSPGDPTAVAVATSSGCAAGATMEQAKQSALLELLERDAVGRWWFGRRWRAGMDPCIFELPIALSEYISERSRRTTLFDISTDLWNPIFAAVSWEPDGRKVAMGFSAQHQASVAAEHALVEMLQIEIGIEQRLMQEQDDIHKWCSEVSSETPPLNCEMTSNRSGVAREQSDKAGLSRILGRLSSNSINVFFIDRTRTEFGIPVVRALAPGLCSDKPRWGWPRLLAPDPNDCRSISHVGSTRPPNDLPLRI